MIDTDGKKEWKEEGEEKRKKTTVSETCVDGIG